MTSTLFSSPHGSVELERGRRLLRIKRTERGFDTLDDCRSFYEGVVAALDGLERRALSLLVDLREAPARNDPAFETTVAGYRKRMFEGFARVAVVVKTAAGKLNVTRHAKSDGHEITVFQDDESALAWLEANGPSPSSRRR